jgi:hypothetical protein
MGDVRVSCAFLPLKVWNQWGSDLAARFPDTGACSCYTVTLWTFLEQCPLKPDMITGSNLRFPANLRCCKGIDDMHGNRATVRYREPFFHDAARIIRTPSDT